jgi:hypothetical protein
MESAFVFRFQASVLPEHHKLWNVRLNDLVMRSAQTSRHESVKETPLLVRYKHEKVRDCFYEHPSLGKLRATFIAVKKQGTAQDAREDYQLAYVLQKTRIADLAVVFPMFPFDVRISVNHEVPGSSLCLDRSSMLLDVIL